jgi:hypothetical protein
MSTETELQRQNDSDRHKAGDERKRAEEVLRQSESGYEQRLVNRILISCCLNPMERSSRQTALRWMRQVQLMLHS